MHNSPATAFGPGVEHDYNWFMGSNEGKIFESAMQTGTENPFVDSSNYDFHLRVPTNTGLPLPEAYSFDMDGVRRAVDGAWDRGAFEFDAPVITRLPA